MTTLVIARRLWSFSRAWLYQPGTLMTTSCPSPAVRAGSVRDFKLDNGPGGYNGPGTTGRTVTFFPELNEPARPTAARPPVSHNAGGIQVRRGGIYLVDLAGCQCNAERTLKRWTKGTAPGGRVRGKGETCRLRRDTKPV